MFGIRLFLYLPRVFAALVVIALPADAVAQYEAPAGYYASAQGLRGAQLKAALHQIIRTGVNFPYTSSSTDTWDILKDADRDPNNPNNVLLVYNRASVNGAQEYNGGSGWTREHVWPQSLGGFSTSVGAGTDAHNLRACNDQVNSRRSNLEFDYGGSPVTIQGLTGTFADGDSFEPSNACKGDVARIIFYMAVRYEGGEEVDLEIDDFTNGGVYSFGKLSSLLAWHLLDPVDDFERRRNARIYAYQGNRNPFIDNPEFAHAVFDPDYQPSGFIVSPASSLPIAGPIGGPYLPSSQNFSITNNSGQALGLVLTADAPWISLDPVSLSLAAASQATISFAINAFAVPAAPGIYSGRIRVTDAASGAFEDHVVSLSVASPVGDFLARQFSTSSPFDLANRSVTFTPDGSANFYRVRIRAATSLPTATTGSVVANLGDDDYLAVTAPAGRVFRLFGVAYPQVFVGSNGYLTFGSGDEDYTPRIEDHFDSARISALFADLVPASGQISYQFLDDRFVATWREVPLHGSGGSNTFQAELFDDGRIRLTWLGVAAISPAVGLSRGEGVPTGFVESNFASAPLEVSAQFEQWVASYGLAPIERGGIEVDSDGDGLSNWQEFAFGASPVAGQGPLMQVQGASNALVFHFFARESGINYVVETTPDLGSGFTPDPDIAIAPSISSRPVPAGYRNMEIAVPLSEKGFFRIKAIEE